MVSTTIVLDGQNEDGEVNTKNEANEHSQNSSCLVTLPESSRGQLIYRILRAHFDPTVEAKHKELRAQWRNYVKYKCYIKAPPSEESPSLDFPCASLEPAKSYEAKNTPSTPFSVPTNLQDLQSGLSFIQATWRLFLSIEKDAIQALYNSVQQSIPDQSLTGLYFLLLLHEMNPFLFLSPFSFFRSTPPLFSAQPPLSRPFFPLPSSFSLLRSFLSPFSTLPSRIPFSSPIFHEQSLSSAFFVSSTSLPLLPSSHSLSILPVNPLSSSYNLLFPSSPTMQYQFDYARFFLIAGDFNLLLLGCESLLYHNIETPLAQSVVPSSLPSESVSLSSQMETSGASDKVLLRVAFPVTALAVFITWCIRQHTGPQSLRKKRHKKWRRFRWVILAPWRLLRSHEEEGWVFEDDNVTGDANVPVLSLGIFAACENCIIIPAVNLGLYTLFLVCTVLTLVGKKMYRLLVRCVNYMFDPGESQEEQHITETEADPSTGEAVTHTLSVTAPPTIIQGAERRKKHAVGSNARRLFDSRGRKVFRSSSFVTMKVDTSERLRRREGNGGMETDLLDNEMDDQYEDIEDLDDLRPSRHALTNYRATFASAIAYVRSICLGASKVVEEAEPVSCIGTPQMLPTSRTTPEANTGSSASGVASITSKGLVESHGVLMKLKRLRAAKSQAMTKPTARKISTKTPASAAAPSTAFANSEPAPASFINTNAIKNRHSTSICGLESNHVATPRNDLPNSSTTVPLMESLKETAIPLHDRPRSCVPLPLKDVAESDEGNVMDLKSCATPPFSAIGSIGAFNSGITPKNVCIADTFLGIITRETSCGNNIATPMSQPDPASSIRAMNITAGRNEDSTDIINNLSSETALNNALNHMDTPSTECLQGHTLCNNASTDAALLVCADTSMADLNGPKLEDSGPNCDEAFRREESQCAVEFHQYNIMAGYEEELMRGFRSRMPSEDWDYVNNCFAGESNVTYNVEHTFDSNDHFNSPPLPYTSTDSRLPLISQQLVSEDWHKNLNEASISDLWEEELLHTSITNDNLADVDKANTSLAITLLYLRNELAAICHANYEHSKTYDIPLPVPMVVEEFPCANDDSQRSSFTTNTEEDHANVIATKASHDGEADITEPSASLFINLKPSNDNFNNDINDNGVEGNNTPEVSDLAQSAQTMTTNLQRRTKNAEKALQTMKLNTEDHIHETLSLSSYQNINGLYENLPGLKTPLGTAAISALNTYPFDCQEALSEQEALSDVETHHDKENNETRIPAEDISGVDNIERFEVYGSDTDSHSRSNYDNSLEKDDKERKEEQTFTRDEDERVTPSLPSSLPSLPPLHNTTLIDGTIHPVPDRRFFDSPTNSECSSNANSPRSFHYIDN